MKSKIQIIAVDDDPKFLDRLTSFINEIPGCELMACLKSGKDLLGIIGTYRPDIILLEIEMPGISGLETARIINSNHAEQKMVAMSLHQGRVCLRQLIEVGFRGFINKANVSEELLHAIFCLSRNKQAFPKSGFQCEKDISGLKQNYYLSNI